MLLCRGCPSAVLASSRYTLLRRLNTTSQVLKKTCLSYISYSVLRPAMPSEAMTRPRGLFFQATPNAVLPRFLVEI